MIERNRRTIGQQKKRTCRKWRLMTNGMCVLSCERARFDTNNIPRRARWPPTHEKLAHHDTVSASPTTPHFIIQKQSTHLFFSVQQCSSSTVWCLFFPVFSPILLSFVWRQNVIFLAEKEIYAKSVESDLLPFSPLLFSPMDQSRKRKEPKQHFCWGQCGVQHEHVDMMDGFTDPLVVQLFSDDDVIVSITWIIYTDSCLLSMSNKHTRNTALEFRSRHDWRVTIDSMAKIVLFSVFPYSTKESYLPSVFLFLEVI